MNHLEPIGATPERAIDLVHHLRDRLLDAKAVQIDAGGRGRFVAFACPRMLETWPPGRSLLPALHLGRRRKVLFPARRDDSSDADPVASVAAGLDDNTPLVPERPHDDVAAWLPAHNEPLLFISASGSFAFEPPGRGGLRIVDLEASSPRAAAVPAEELPDAAIQ